MFREMVLGRKFLSEQNPPAQVSNGTNHSIFNEGGRLFRLESEEAWKVFWLLAWVYNSDVQGTTLGVEFSGIPPVRYLRFKPRGSKIINQTFPKSPN